MIDTILLQQILCDNAVECKEIAGILYSVIKHMIYPTVYLSLGWVTVEEINNRSFNIFNKLSIMGVNRGFLFFIGFILAVIWPVIWILLGYGRIKSKISNYKQND